ncbi:histamine H2 receptor [Hydra vulgaris]|uniref:histamine H2 receptor n=1 Tax=Hydra vulgaris TaxID=6087 RepID=UPI001F5EA9B8|nr:histamine H2 receptor-like [Hydra vulgaris]
MIANTTINIYIYCCILYTFKDHTGNPERVKILSDASHCFNHTNKTLQWRSIRNSIKASLSQNPPDCQNHYKDFKCSKGPLPKYVFYIVFWVFLFLFGFVGNFSVLLSVVRSSILKKSKINYFIVSLAASDLSVALFIVPIKVIQAYNNLGFCHSLNACKFYITLDTILFVASITNLFAISVDRFAALRFPNYYNNKIKSCQNKLFVGSIWLYALFCGILINFEWGFLSKDSIEILPETQECIAKNKYYIVILYIFVYYIPAAVMFVAFMRVLQISRKNMKNTKKFSNKKCSSKSSLVKYFSKLFKKQTLQQTKATYLKTDKSEGIVSVNLIEICEISAKSKSNFTLEKYKHSYLFRKLTITFMAMYLLFLVCWTPVSILAIGLRLYPYWFQGVNAVVWPHIIFVDILPILRSTINPFIYGFTSRECRKTFCTLLASICFCICKKRKHSSFSSEIELKTERISEFKTERKNEF